MSQGSLPWLCFSFFPFILWSWIFLGPFFGLGSVTWAVGVVCFVALACRQLSFLWLSLECAGMGFVSHWGLARWRQTWQISFLQEEHLKEEVNTCEGELNHLGEVEKGLLSRRKRYQQLRSIANTFSATLQMTELCQRIVEAAGEVLARADLSLLYLVDPKTLALELTAVWRRSGNVTVKTKRGDPFDVWVMRHAQPLHVEEPLDDFRFPHGVQENLGRPLGALVAVPLVNEARFMGVLRVESHTPRGLSADDLRLVRITGDLASLAIENSRLYNRMAQLSITDDLTGLSVRSYFQKRFAEEIARAGTLEVPVSLLMIDIDRFKVYNDTFGHTAGDKLLKHFAQILLARRRPGDVVARYGGEEFVCLLPSVDTSEALALAERIRSEMEQAPIELRRERIPSSVSIGVATFPQDAHAPEPLLLRADERLYRAKTLGRNRVCGP